MRPRLIALTFGCVLVACVAGLAVRGGAVVQAAEPKKSNAPEYTKDGELLAPAKYREWVFLTSGFDMAYLERTGVPEHSVFDNVFVNPEAYASFLETGTWPDKTVMVLEGRGARAKGEVIIKGGRFQGGVEGLEVHVKDSGRFNRGGVGGQWGFFDVGTDGKGKLFAPTASCYRCHAEHAAVDTTFVQFYPTLIGVAEKKGTLSEAYRKERVDAPVVHP